MYMMQRLHVEATILELTTMASFASQISSVLLFLLFTTTFNCVISCNESDERLLLIFKQGVVDPNNQLSSWTTEEDCCLWEGVHCNNMTGRVTELSLFNHTLRGDINLCVLQLEFLNHLDLSHNDFKTVSMPPCQISKSPFDAHKFHNQSLATPSNHLASFSVALCYLNFSHNYELVIKDLHWLSQLSFLKYLDLSYSYIGDDTKWLQHIAMLPALSELHLSGSRLRDFPSHDYINLTSLEVLDLSLNFDMVKSKLLDSFFNITHQIHHLDLAFCNFHGQLPKSLHNLKNLKYLDLGYNNFEGSILYWLGQFEQLQYLDITHNLFHGIIPSSLGNISSLFYLYLSYNQLNGNIPATLGQLHNLIQLDIGNNFLAGVLTKIFFAGLPSLTLLGLYSSSFKFDFDPKWVPSFQLETLDMGNTSIGPNVPPWLYTQQSLRKLNISGSGISTIDKDIFWNFVAGIEDVDISDNLISDNISGVTLSANVSYFYASHSSLSGSIFSLLCQLEGNGESNLVGLDLSYNHLSGALPDCWTNRKSLEFLILGSNKLTGKVPPSFASLGLQLLDLSDNSFFGEFSSSMLNWTNLQFLILEKNNFSGSLPNPYMARSLEVLKLRTNQFMGNIPPGICMLSSLRILELANNKLFGSIPSCLCNITNPNNISSYFYLREVMRIFTKGRELDYQPSAYFTRGVIDLSANSLSGEIPEELFSITLLWSLNLSRNHLIGKISKEIGALENLESLDLSYNRLSGEIPSTISNLSFLACLNLSYNNLIGQIPLGTQIQSFDSWSFVGNHELCGDPLPKKCNKKEETRDNSKPAERDEDDGFLKSLYLGMGVGFAAGFWGICGSLFLIRAWRHRFFRWFDHLKDQLYVAFTLWFKRFGRISKTDLP